MFENSYPPSARPTFLKHAIVLREGYKMPEKRKNKVTLEYGNDIIKKCRKLVKINLRGDNYGKNNNRRNGPINIKKIHNK